MHALIDPHGDAVDDWDDNEKARARESPEPPCSQHNCRLPRICHLQTEDDQKKRYDARRNRKWRIRPLAGFGTGEE
jgi:hypothetical protein